MKKFFALLLCLCFTAGSCYALELTPEEREERRALILRETRLLWDIPFDSTYQECADLLLEKQGIQLGDLVPGTMGDYETAKANATFLGHPTIVTCAFADEAISSFRFAFQGSVLTSIDPYYLRYMPVFSAGEAQPLMEKDVAAFAGLIEAVQEEYGAEITFGLCSTTVEGAFTTINFPHGENGGIDMARLNHILEKEKYLLLEVELYNITLSFQTHWSADENLLNTYQSLTFNRRWLPSLRPMGEAEFEGTGVDYPE